FTEWNPYCWFGHEYGEDGVCVRCKAEKEEEDPEQANGNVVIETVVTEGMQLYAAPVALADDSESYTLTATVTPAAADDKRVEWTVGWKNANSVWAIGKNVSDYVTVTPAAAYALTATVSCIKDFGEQVIVTVTSLDNANAHAQCTVDYVRRILDVQVNVPAISNCVTPFTYDITYSNYTIAGELVLEGEYACLEIQSEVSAKLRSMGLQPFVDFYLYEELDGFVRVDLDSQTVTFPFVLFDDAKDQWFSLDKDILGSFLLINQDTDQDREGRGIYGGDVYKAFRDVAKTTSNDISIDFTFYLVYNGECYSECYKAVYAEIDTDAIHFSTSRVSVSQGSLVF
ncbi:MAG: hypothetical protein NC332_05800, partial [Firmicutes bacterium]|nr:hypothetical protein [Bacillota bacterium]